ncbi:MAG: ABC transporter permease [Bacillota bacterium]|nr:ABC transporter permease [Bacillota bacterium]
MKHWRTVFAAVLYRDLVMFQRYAFNTVSGLITLYIVFLLIFFGISKFDGGAVVSASTVESMIVGYVLWSMSIAVYSELAWSITNEAQVGTLEQLYLCPLGFGFVNACHLVSSLLTNVLFNAVLLLAAMATTGRWLLIDLVSLTPVVLLTLGGVYGIGFAVGGLALVYKRIQGFFQIVQFIFVGFMMVPLDVVPWARWLPLAMGNELARRIMVGGQRVWHFPVGDLVTLVVTAAVYLALGVVAFRVAERVARNRGTLGQY